MNREQARLEFGELMASPTARSKIGRFREVFDLVDAALRAGVARTIVIERLAKLGLDLTPATFKSYLERIRAESIEPPGAQLAASLDTDRQSAPGPATDLAAPPALSHQPPGPSLPTGVPAPQTQPSPSARPVNLRAIREQEYDLDAMRREWRKIQRGKAAAPIPPEK